MSWDHVYPIQVTDVGPEAGARGVERSGSGIVLDALRDAGVRGLSRKRIVDILGCWGNDKETTEIHAAEIDSILAYLCGLGVARASDDRWFVITGHEMLKTGFGFDLGVEDRTVELRVTKL